MNFASSISLASYPFSKSANVDEQKLMFSTTHPLDEISHARPFISAWAVKLVAAEARKQVGNATRNDPGDPDDHTQLRARTNPSPPRRHSPL
ncbi:hypothetical protein B0H13DRAFT_2337383 [Mycena leptocephala]|nr:hypothetical protein B0H13DRAFT_2337383 [Mycena leptocephala]